MTRTRALLLDAFAVMFLSAGVGAQTPHRSLAGRLLVATDAMNDTRFERAVIYIVRHDAQGAFGLVVNLPRGEAPYERALRPLDLEVPPGSGSLRRYWGGPVGERRGFVLHTPDWTGEGTEVVDRHFALTEDPRVLQAMAAGKGPSARAVLSRLRGLGAGAARRRDEGGRVGRGAGRRAARLRRGPEAEVDRGDEPAAARPLRTLTIKTGPRARVWYQ